MRFFNTAGPCVEGRHYMLPPIERLPEAPKLVERGMYFVVHAPRQTGKTTTLRTLAQRLTADGRFAALHFSCEVGRIAEDDHVATQRSVLHSIQRTAEIKLPEALQPPATWPARDDAHLLQDGLSAWARTCPLPLVLFFDEIDALQGNSLLNVLGQLRAGYDTRPDSAPWSVALCGLRDVRDYKAASGGDPNRLGTSSPFNIKVESMRLRDFTAEQVGALYRQHTDDTGQPFTDEAVARAFELTRGQPWLVNALAYEIIDKMHLAPPTPITAAHVEDAKERLILARATHLDSLVARLQEGCVRRVVEPLLAGTYEGEASYDDDFEYVRDLGLIAPDRPPRPANPIYREVITRVLASGVERRMIHETKTFLTDDGRIDLPLVLRKFAAFWRQHGEVLTGSLTYHEVAPQLVLMAYIQSIANGNGFIDREYGIGRGRFDLCLRWPYTGPDGRRAWQREAIELKLWHDKQRDPLDKGLADLDDYLGGLGLDTGVLVIFDRRTDRPGARATGDLDAGRVPAEIDLDTAETPRGRSVTVLRA